MSKRFFQNLTISGLGMIMGFMIVSESSAQNQELCKHILEERSKGAQKCVDLVGVCYYGGCSFLCDKEQHNYCQGQCDAGAPPIVPCVNACNHMKTANPNICEGDCPSYDYPFEPHREICAPDQG